MALISLMALCVIALFAAGSLTGAAAPEQPIVVAFHPDDPSEVRYRDG
jgi:hypothetical protein